MTGALTGTGKLLRFVLRRDRTQLPVWILAIVGGVLATAPSLPSSFPTPADRQQRAELMDSPAMAALVGPTYGADNYTIGAMVANEYMLFTAIFVALMSIFLVTRHTRVEEETGGAELIRATAVGRHAMTAATLLVAGAANLVVGGLLGLLLPVVLDDLPAGSSLLFGAALAAIGLVFTAVAALTAQLTGYSRAANGLAGAVLGAFYVVRGVGDAGNGVLSWLSPLGWSQATKVYVADRWWPLLLSVALAGVTMVAAFAVSARRDLGAGVLAQRPGPPRASQWLTRPIGFALRLQRASLIAWGAALLLAGLMYGSLAEQVAEFVEENDVFQRMLGLEDLTPAQLAEVDKAGEFFSMVLGFMAVLAAGYALQSTLRLHGEENADRAEPLLATALDRWRWAGSHLVIALIGTVAVLALVGLGLGLAAAVTLSDSSQLPRLFGAALVHVPSVWALVGVAVALFGFVPRAAPWVWAALGYSAFITSYGQLLELPSWVTGLTPFGHTPQLPSESLDPVPLAALTAIAAGLTAAGLYGFRRRDIQMG